MQGSNQSNTIIATPPAYRARQSDRIKKEAPRKIRRASGWRERRKIDQATSLSILLRSAAVTLARGRIDHLRPVSIPSADLNLPRLHFLALVERDLQHAL